MRLERERERALNPVQPTYASLWSSSRGPNPTRWTSGRTPSNSNAALEWGLLKKKKKKKKGNVEVGAVPAVALEVLIL